MKGTSKARSGAAVGVVASQSGVRRAVANRGFRVPSVPSTSAAAAKYEPPELVEQEKQQWVSVKMEGLLVTNLMYELHQRSNRLTDTHVICSDGYIPVHRCVLMAASPFLNELLLHEDPAELASISLPDFTLKQVLPLISSFYNGCTVFDMKEVTSTLELIKIFQADKSISYNMHPAKEPDLKWTPKMRSGSLQSVSPDLRSRRVVQFSTDLLDSSDDSPPMLIPEEELVPESPSAVAEESRSSGRSYEVDIEEVTDPSYEPAASEDSDVEIIEVVPEKDNRAASVTVVEACQKDESSNGFDDDYVFSPTSLDAASNVILRADGTGRNDDEDEVEERDPLELESLLYDEGFNDPVTEEARVRTATTFPTIAFDEDGQHTQLAQIITGPPANRRTAAHRSRRSSARRSSRAKSRKGKKTAAARKAAAVKAAITPPTLMPEDSAEASTSAMSPPIQRSFSLRSFLVEEEKRRRKEDIQFRDKLQEQIQQSLMSDLQHSPTIQDDFAPSPPVYVPSPAKTDGGDATTEESNDGHEIIAQTSSRRSSSASSNSNNSLDAGERLRRAFEKEIQNVDRTIQEESEQRRQKEEEEKRKKELEEAQLRKVAEEQAARLAEEQRKKFIEEQRRLAEEQKELEEQHRIEAKKREDARKEKQKQIDERKRLEAQREQEAQHAEEQRRLKELQRAQEEQKRNEEAARKLAEQQQEEQRLAEQQKVEKALQLEELRKREEAKQVEEKRKLEEIRLLEEKKRQEEVRKLEEKKRQEEARKLEEERRRAEELKILEERRRAQEEEARRVEEEQKQAEEAIRLLEEERERERHERLLKEKRRQELEEQLEQQRQLEEARRIEEQRQQARRLEEQQRKERLRTKPAEEKAENRTKPAEPRASVLIQRTETEPLRAEQEQEADQRRNNGEKRRADDSPVDAVDKFKRPKDDSKRSSRWDNPEEIYKAYEERSRSEQKLQEDAKRKAAEEERKRRAAEEKRRILEEEKRRIMEEERQKEEAKRKDEERRRRDSDRRRHDDDERRRRNDDDDRRRRREDDDRRRRDDDGDRRRRRDDDDDRSRSTSNDSRHSNHSNRSNRSETGSRSRSGEDDRRRRNEEECRQERKRRDDKRQDEARREQEKQREREAEIRRAEELRMEEEKRAEERRLAEENRLRQVEDERRAREAVESRMRQQQEEEEKCKVEEQNRQKEEDENRLREEEQKKQAEQVRSKEDAEERKKREEQEAKRIEEELEKSIEISMLQQNTNSSSSDQDPPPLPLGESKSKSSKFFEEFCAKKLRMAEEKRQREAQEAAAKAQQQQFQPPPQSERVAEYVKDTDSVMTEPCPVDEVSTALEIVDDIPLAAHEIELTDDPDTGSNHAPVVNDLEVAQDVPDIMAEETVVETIEEPATPMPETPVPPPSVNTPSEEGSIEVITISTQNSEAESSTSSPDRIPKPKKKKIKMREKHTQVKPQNLAITPLRRSSRSSSASIPETEPSPLSAAAKSLARWPRRPIKVVVNGKKFRIVNPSVTVSRLSERQFKQYWVKLQKFKRARLERADNTTPPTLTKASSPTSSVSSNSSTASTASSSASSTAFKKGHWVIVKGAITDANPATKASREPREEASQPALEPHKKQSESNAVCIPSLIVQKDLEYYQKELRRCSHCQKKYKTHGKATACLQSHGFKRCLICLDLIHTNDMAYELHYTKFHMVKDKRGQVGCPVCGQLVLFKGLPGHVSRKHLMTEARASSSKLQKRRSSAEQQQNSEQKQAKPAYMGRSIRLSESEDDDDGTKKPIMQSNGAPEMDRAVLYGFKEQPTKAVPTELLPPPEGAKVDDDTARRALQTAHTPEIPVDPEAEKEPPIEIPILPSQVTVQRTSVVVTESSRNPSPPQEPPPLPPQVIQPQHPSPPILQPQPQQAIQQSQQQQHQQLQQQFDQPILIPRPRQAEPTQPKKRILHAHFDAQTHDFRSNRPAPADVHRIAHNSHYYPAPPPINAFPGMDWHNRMNLGHPQTYPHPHSHHMPMHHQQMHQPQQQQQQHQQHHHSNEFPIINPDITVDETGSVLCNLRTVNYTSSPIPLQSNYGNTNASGGPKAVPANNEFYETAAGLSSRPSIFSPPPPVTTSSSGSYTDLSESVRRHSSSSHHQHHSMTTHHHHQHHHTTSNIHHGTMWDSHASAVTSAPSSSSGSAHRSSSVLSITPLDYNMTDSYQSGLEDYRCNRCNQQFYYKEQLDDHSHHCQGVYGLGERGSQF